MPEDHQPRFSLGKGAVWEVKGEQHMPGLSRTALGLRTECKIHVF